MESRETKAKRKCKTLDLEMVYLEREPNTHRRLDKYFNCKIYQIKVAGNLQGKATIKDKRRHSVRNILNLEAANDPADVPIKVIDEDDQNIIEYLRKQKMKNLLKRMFSL